jgi:transketolase
VREGSDATVIATGMGVAEAAAASDRLRDLGIGVRVLDAFWLKPFDTEGVVAAAQETGAIVTVEEHNVINGLGTAVAEAVALAGMSVPIERIGMQDEYAVVAPPTHLYRHYGLTADNIAQRVRALVGR